MPDMDSRKSHNTADSVNGVEARIGQQSAMPGLAKRVAIKRTLAARYKITIRVRCKIWPEAVKAGNDRSAVATYTWNPSHDQCGMLRPLGTSSAD